MLTLTLRLTRTAMVPNDSITAHVDDEVVLADGQVLAVPRANLAAAKALLAAQKAAARRVEGTHGLPGTSSVYCNDTIGRDSGVRPIAVRGVEPRRWMRDERARAEKAS